jgi:hypothetical protein
MIRRRTGDSVTSATIAVPVLSMVQGASLAANGASMEEVSASIRKLVDNGATEIQFQPAGHDIPRELDRFMTAAQRA